MSTDLATSSPLPSPEDPEIYSSESAHLGTFGDIDPNYRLNNVQCRAIELALDGLRWSQIAQILKISRKTLWRWKTQDRIFRQALADSRAERHAFAIERCQTFASRAASVLARFLDDPADKTRMRAAQLLLQAAARFKPPPDSHPFVLPEYPDPPLLTPFPPRRPEPELEPKVG